MFKAIINESKEYQIEEKDNQYMINGRVFELDVQAVSPHYLHVIHNHQSYRAEISKVDYEEKTFVFKINGQEIALKLKDRFDLLLEKMGMSDLAGSSINDIKAPMPGLILDIKVAEGDAVQKGDALLILEAMKMENVIKSPGEGVIKEVKIKQGDSVEKNQVLIQF